MTKSKKKKGFGKKAVHIRTAAAASPVPAAAATSRKTRNNYANEKSGDGNWSMVDLGSLGKDTAMPKGTGMMQELARNTRNKTAHWDQGSKLRDRPVVFVSGGYIEPIDELESELPAPADQPLPAASSVVARPALPVAAEMNNMQASPRHSSNHNATLVPQDPSDSDSDSSTEVILFKGRNGNASTKPDKRTEYNSNATKISTGQQRHNAIADNRGSSGNSGSLDHLLLASDDESGNAAAIDDYIANILLGDTDDATKQAQRYYRELGERKSEFISDAYERFDTGAKEKTHLYTGDSTCSTGDDKGHDGVWCNSKDEPNSLDDEDKLAVDIDDEHLARLFAKQEELGFEASELILLDGDAVSLPKSPRRDDRTDDQAEDNKGFISRKMSKSLLVRDLQRLKPRDGSYPSAEAVADAFELLEVTSWGNEYELGLSDSELEATLLASWQKDSQRKRDRKKAREERRSQGLLGNNINTNDTRIKYPNGMSLNEIRLEFQGFLLGSEQSVTLPPMDAHARKIIHELAHRFGITSKSTGAGKQRRPTLVRKKGTFKFDSDHFDGVFSRIGRRYFARLDARQAGEPQKLRGGSSAAVVVRNGEIVGGSAPEIGQENKGRTMLEKMGWSMGMALGAVDNKGMTQPIEHVVKRSKAGLG